MFRSYLSRVIALSHLFAVCIQNTSAFGDISHNELTNRIIGLSDRHQNIVVSDADSDFGIGVSGLCSINSTSVPCRQWIIRLNQKSFKHQEISDVPEFFLSGAIHGDERIGPVVVIEIANLLLEASRCRNLEDCDLRMNRHQILWLSHLISTREIILMPAANAIGFSENQRLENSLDPNRDFPYEAISDTKCMRTLTARAINEVYQSGLIQLGLTFHGGMEMIGYEWGSPNHDKPSSSTSPDEISQSDISAAMSAFSSTHTVSNGRRLSQSKFYPYGRLNDVIYTVNGGMEDWAYASSWDKKGVSKCSPVTYNGYDVDRVEYDDAVLRSCLIIVETSKNKNPQAHDWGDEEWIFNRQLVGSDGYVTRNIRLSLAALDLIQPYICLHSLSFHSNIVNHAMKAKLSWHVGGSMVVDKSWVVVKRVNQVTLLEHLARLIVWTLRHADHRSSSYSQKSKISCASPEYCPLSFIDPESAIKALLRIDNLDDFLDKEMPAGLLMGRALWGDVVHRKLSDQFVVSDSLKTRLNEKQATHNNNDKEEAEADGWIVLSSQNWTSMVSSPVPLDQLSLYTSTVDLNREEEGVYVMAVVAQVDSHWSHVPSQASPKGLPVQSHLANARTLSSWNKTHGDKQVRGRRYWLSPLTLFEISHNVVGPVLESVLLNPLPCSNYAACVNEKAEPMLQMMKMRDEIDNMRNNATVVKSRTGAVQMIFKPQYPKDILPPQEEEDDEPVIKQTQSYSIENWILVLLLLVSAVVSFVFIRRRVFCVSTVSDRISSSPSTGTERQQV